jgi:putative hydrolase of the HAD superfamily
LLLSFGGVLWQPVDAATRRIEERSGLVPGTIEAVAFAPVRAVAPMLGRASRAAWREAVAAELADDVGGLESAEKIVEEWYGVRGRIVLEVVNFIDEVRAAGVPVGVCANGIDEVPDDLAARVDAVVNAVDVGISVPHPEFFATACAALATEPKQCLYADVAPRNIAGARAAGLLGYRFGGVESLSYLRSAMIV